MHAQRYSIAHPLAKKSAAIFLATHGWHTRLHKAERSMEYRNKKGTYSSLMTVLPSAVESFGIAGCLPR